MVGEPGPRSLSRHERLLTIYLSLFFQTLQGRCQPQAKRSARNERDYKKLVSAAEGRHITAYLEGVT